MAEERSASETCRTPTGVLKRSVSAESPAGHAHSPVDSPWTSVDPRRYLDDADELLRTENTAVAFFNAKIERYPNHLARTVLWAGASALYGVREHPGEDVAPILVAGWL
jgi:hypothetical protein